MKRFTCILISFMFFALPLFACHDKSNVSCSQDTKAPQKVTELKFFGFKGGAEIGAIEELICQFNSENPDINVSYEGIWNSGYPDLLGARLAAGQGDDVFLAHPNYISKLQNAGYVDDLSDMLVVNNYSELVKSLSIIDNKIPGLPLELAALGMFTNKDLLKSYNIKQPQNLDEFMYACQVLKDRGVTPIIAASKDGTGIGALCSAVGLYSLYTADDKYVQIADIKSGKQILSDTIKSGGEFVRELVQRGFLDAESTLVTVPAQEDITEFAKGNTAFMIGGGWSLSAVQKAMPQTDVVLSGLPVDNANIIMVNAGVRICINSKGTHKSEARRFVEFMTSTESSDKYVASQNAFSPLVNGKGTSSPAMADAAALIKSGSIIPWMDTQFVDIDPFTLSKTYSSKIIAGGSIDEAAEEMNTSIMQTISNR